MAILNESESRFEIDDFLDFTPEDDKVLKTNFNSVSAFSITAAEAEEEEERSHGSSPKFLEEDLEWITNEEAFPSVDTCFDILSDNLDLVFNNHSPVSVLGKSTTNNESNTATFSSYYGILTGLRGFPVRPRTKSCRRKRTTGLDLFSQRVWVPIPTRSNNRAFMGRKCSHCQADKTPQWRAGPMGPKTLCNACGVRYKMGRLVPEYRPVNSPTFSSVLHSNSHRKILEMRRNKCGTK